MFCQSSIVNPLPLASADLSKITYTQGILGSFRRILVINFEQIPRPGLQAVLEPAIIVDQLPTNSYGNFVPCNSHRKNAFYTKILSSKSTQTPKTKTKRLTVEYFMFPTLKQQRQLAKPLSILRGGVLLFTV